MKPPESSQNDLTSSENSLENPTENPVITAFDQEPVEDSSSPHAPYWVVIGASAGGLEALKELLSALKKPYNAIIIIAQHLDPKHPTILRDLLARTTDMPVILVEKDTKPQLGIIYVVSPGHNALINNRKITLQPAAAIGPKPSINLLLSTLAEDIGEQAIAVILSGTGSDGSQGIMAIKSANGLVIAQDEKTAKYSGMPRSAIDSGFVDIVLPPAAIADEIQNFIKSAGQTFKNVSSPKIKSSLEKIFQRIFDQTGYDFSGYKLKTIQRRLARRMAVHKLITIDDYVTLLTSSSAEVESLFKDLLISVTAFFRDKEAFEDLNGIIEQLVEQTPDQQQLRIWVPGCANGEEAYSIAILVQQARLKLRREINFQIFATDIDEFALSKARKGLYSKEQLKELPDSIVSQYFICKDEQFLVNKSVRDHVVFARQNLIMDPPFSKIDLISCRNLLIYFTLELQRQVFQTFHFALKPMGFLFLGKSESASTAVPELFESHIKKSQIFIRKASGLSSKLDHISSAISLSNLRQNQNGPQFTQEKRTTLDQLDRVLLEQMIPTAIVLDGSGQILHIRGHANAYLSFPQGRIDTNILSLIRDDLKMDIRALLQKCKRDGKANTQALFYKHQLADKALFLAMQRFDEPSANVAKTQELFVLSFTEVDLSEAFIAGTGLLNSEDSSINDSLRKEIAIFKERLQTSIEELETSNEELQSTNEEMQSANEELQSANEELQTANEELQSTNEELSTVNQELEVKSHELEQVNNDLENMLSSMHEKVVLIDSRLRVLRYTATAADTFGIDLPNIGQPITTIGLKIDIPNFRNLLLNVIESEQEQTLKVRQNSVIYQLRISPYKSAMTQLVGLMLFFEHATHKSTLNPEIDCHITLKLLGNHLPFALISIDESGVMTYLNEQVSTLLGYDVRAMLFQNIKMLMPTPYRDHHDQYIEHYRQGKTPGLMGQWRDITALHANGERVLLKLKTEETWINAERHYLGFLLSIEQYREHYQ